MTIVYILAAVAAGLLLGWLLGRVAKPATAAGADTELEGKRILEAAQAQVEELRKAAEMQGKEAALRLRNEAEEGARQQKARIAKESEELAKREREVDRQMRDLQRRDSETKRREKTLESREKSAEASVRKAEEAQAQAKRELEAVANMTADQARKALEEEMKEQARAQVAAEIKQIEDEANARAAETAQRIIATAIQRYASEFVHERTVSVVPLPSDDLKGRLIGREGRNIRALEAASGIDLIIDDTSEAITISCFNPVRREVARLAIGKLVADGRIHPTRIEEVVAKSEKEVARSAKEAGEQAVFDLGLSRMHPELVRLLGELKFRNSYAQNLLHHSVEVGYLAGLIAAELGVSVKLARRAGLLHDIGNAVDHKQEGSHAEVGAQLARKYGESPRICDAIANHHGDAQRSLLDHVVAAANELSNARPGARREALASYVKRLENLEALCGQFKGVQKAFALMAGREIRVLVQNDQMDDAQALLLSKEIAQRIEDETTYAGQIRVVVMRETRATDYAR